MTQAEKPTIVISHGAWHGPWCFRPLAAALQAQGYPVICRRHPTCSDDINFGQYSLYDDADALRSEVEKHVNRGKTVYVLAHSYGGAVMTEAITSDLAFGRSKGREGGVAGIVYVCAFMMRLNQTVVALFMEYSEEEVAAGRPAVDGTADLQFNQEENSIAHVRPHDRFYNNLPPEDQEKYSKMLVPMSAGSNAKPMTRCAWASYPSMYIYCTQDTAVAFRLQQSMVAKAKQLGANVVSEPVMDCGHSPFFADVDGCARHIDDFVVTVERQRLG